jgi:hypothetical protein
MPTQEQLKTTFILSYWVTKMYLAIYLITIDIRTKNIAFLAGDELEIILYPNVNWRFL